MSPGEGTGLWCPPEANLQKSDSKGSSTPGDTSTVSCMLPFFSFFLPAGSSQAVHNHGIAYFSLEESAKFTWEKRSQNPGASSTLVTNTLKGLSGNWHIVGTPPMCLWLTLWINCITLGHGVQTTPQNHSFTFHSVLVRSYYSPCLPDISSPYLYSQCVWPFSHQTL